MVDGYYVKLHGYITNIISSWGWIKHDSKPDLVNFSASVSPGLPSLSST